MSSTEETLKFSFPEIREAEVKRLLAEAAKTEIEAEREKIKLEEERQQSELRLREKSVELEKKEEELAKLRVDSNRARTELVVVEQRAAIGQIEQWRAEQLRKDELARDRYHHRYFFNTEVTEVTVNTALSSLTRWSRQDPACDIELVINSPGGSIRDGFALIDYLLYLREAGHKVTTVALGMSASMAAVILQAGTERVMGRNAVLLIHQGSLGAWGSYGEVEDRVKLMDLFHDRILNLFEERAAGKITREEIKRNWERKDWWIKSEDALKYGLVDRIQ